MFDSISICVYFLLVSDFRRVDLGNSYEYSFYVSRSGTFMRWKKYRSSWPPEKEGPKNIRFTCVHGQMLWKERLK